MQSRLEILESSLIERIIDEAMSVLETRGVLVDHEPSFDRLCEGGLDGDIQSRRITFPRAAIEAAIESAPSGFSLFDRDGKEHARLEGKHLGFAHPAPQIID